MGKGPKLFKLRSFLVEKQHRGTIPEYQQVVGRTDLTPSARLFPQRCHKRDSMRETHPLEVKGEKKPDLSSKLETVCTYDFPNYTVYILRLFNSVNKSYPAREMQKVLVSAQWLLSLLPILAYVIYHSSHTRSLLLTNHQPSL